MSKGDSHELICDLGPLLRYQRLQYTGRELALSNIAIRGRDGWVRGNSAEAACAILLQGHAEKVLEVLKRCYSAKESIPASLQLKHAPLEELYRQWEKRRTALALSPSALSDEEKDVQIEVGAFTNFSMGVFLDGLRTRDVL